MKLYTEKQVIRMIELARFTYNSEDKIILSQTPIELPNDEEIEFNAPFSFGAFGFEQGMHRGFVSGATWMRSKIEGGNK